MAAPANTAEVAVPDQKRKDAEDRADLIRAGYRLPRGTGDLAGGSEARPGPCMARRDGRQAWQGQRWASEAATRLRRQAERDRGRQMTSEPEAPPNQVKVYVDTHNDYDPEVAHDIERAATIYEKSQEEIIRIVVQEYLDEDESARAALVADAIRRYIDKRVTGNPNLAEHFEKR